MEKKTFKMDLTSNFAKRRYRELQNKSFDKLSQKQRDFVVDMYHFEEELTERMLENETESFLWGY